MISIIRIDDEGVGDVVFYDNHTSQYTFKLILNESMWKYFLVYLIVNLGLLSHERKQYAHDLKAVTKYTFLNLDTVIIHVFLHNVVTFKYLYFDL